ncbi:MAG: WbqC family protein [Muribaculaceae bacterium]|nr:WbqC family protein [Muribaculaceae bacterium]
MVGIPPFLPSFSWMRVFVCERIRGAGIEEAVARANSHLSLSGKDFAHALVRSAGGEILLSIPIEGGGKMLKRRGSLQSLVMSEHGNWRHVHLGAFEACYGRAPFFGDLFPDLRRIYEEPICRLTDFNTALLNLIEDFIGVRGLAHTYEFPLTSPALERGLELAAAVDEKLSAIDAIMRLGRETILPLLALYQQTEENVM